MKIFKPGTKTDEELEYEMQFEKSVQKCREHNIAKNYSHAFNKKYKNCVRRKHIPIYWVDNKTKEILGKYNSMKAAGESIGMATSNFSYMMMDRPIYKPVLIKGRWFIKQSHYEQWKSNN